MSLPPMPTIGVFGATGQVGSVMRTLLDERGFPVGAIRYFASARSAGTTLPWKGTEITVEDTATADFSGIDIALFSNGATQSREYAPKVAAAGAIVVDNSSAWRMDPDVPLVVAEVNPHALASIPKGIVANPNCTTMQIMLPLKALDDAFGLRAIVATSYQAAGGAGQKGIDELARQVPVVLERLDDLVNDGAKALRGIEHSVHAKPLAFNVVPWLGSEAGDGYSDEELKLRNESRKILELPDLAVTPTCVRVGVMVGHSVQVRATFEREPHVDEALEALAAFPGVELDNLATPVEWAGRDEVAVGRVRKDLGDPLSLNLWVVGDNLLKGAALNTVQLAELLVADRAAAS